MIRTPPELSGLSPRGPDSAASSSAEINASVMRCPYPGKQLQCTPKRPVRDPGRARPRAQIPTIPCRPRRCLTLAAHRKSLSRRSSGGGQQPEADAIRQRHVGGGVARPERHAIAPGLQRMLEVKAAPEAKPVRAGGRLEAHLPAK